VNQRKLALGAEKDVLAGFSKKLGNRYIAAWKVLVDRSSGRRRRRPPGPSAGRNTRRATPMVTAARIRLAVPSLSVDGKSRRPALPRRKPW
jgi:hypothetical protein